jgi:ribosomal protein L24
MKKPSKKTRTPKAKRSGKWRGWPHAVPIGLSTAKGTIAIATVTLAQKKTKSNGRPSDKIVERELPVELTEKELMKLGDEAAEDQRGIEQIKMELKNLNQDKRELEAQRTRKLHDIKAGIEQRLVKCRIEEDLDKNVLRVTRNDTGKIIEQRALTLAERQGELGFSMGARAPDDDGTARSTSPAMDELMDELELAGAEL